VIDRARIVVVGGGAIGCGVAFQLAEAGHSDVLVLEREEGLCRVTSAQAAGLVGQVRSSVERTRLAMWSVATFDRLEREGEVKPGWRQVGSLRVAQTPERVEEFRRLADVAKQAGLEVELVDREAAQRMWPVLDWREARAVLWCPTDGYLQPADLVAAYRHEARRRGVRFRTGAPVTGIRLRDGRVQAVDTPEGEIGCEIAVNAAGAHGWHVGRLVGLDLPVVPVRHHYIVTVPADGLSPALPCLRLPDATLYARAEMRGLLLGGWEPEALSIDPRRFGLADPLPPIAEDWPVLSGFVEAFRPFGGGLCDLPVRRVFTGWPTFTPDGRFLVGPCSDVPGFACAVGCNAHGVSGSAGIGRHLVEALFDPDPSPWVRSLSPDRFARGGWSWPEAERAARRVYETYYHIGH
jgi:glycine/D-amino acid oxidase-like deaminating enzyme